MVRAELAGDRGLRRAAGGGDDAGADGLGPLQQDLADASGRGVDENGLARP